MTASGGLMSLSVSPRPLFSGATVSTAEVASAVALVKAGGVTEKAIAPLVDAFVAAAGEGRVSATTRQAFQKALLGLVGELPQVPSSVLVRRDEVSLTKSIAATSTTIDKQTARIGVLKDEVATLSSSLKTKKAETFSLLQTQESLQTALKASKAQESKTLNNSLLAMFIGSFAGTGGMTTAVTNVAMVNGVTAALSLDEINRRLTALETEIPQTRNVVASLQRQLDAASTLVAAEQQTLSGLELVETSLRARVTSTATTATTTTAAPATLADRLKGLAVSLEAHQALSANLGKQIAVLETMKTGLTSSNTMLDGLIAELRVQNDDLRTEIASSKQAIKSTLIDLALSSSGFAKTIDIGALHLSTKELLLNGIEGLRLSVLSQARTIANDQITGAALGMSSTSMMGRLFLGSLEGNAAEVRAATAGFVNDVVKDTIKGRGFGSASAQVLVAMLRNDQSGAREAALNGVLDSLDTLTAPQRFLIEQLLFAPRTTSTPLNADMVLEAINRVAADPTITESRARTIAATVAAGGTADVIGFKSDPVLHWLDEAPAVAIAQATPSTEKFWLSSPDDQDLGRLGHLSPNHLRIRGDKHTLAGLQTALSSLPSLRVLMLHDDRVLNDNNLSVLTPLSSLTHLNVDGTALTGTGIAASPVAANLIHVELERTSQSRADLVALAAMPTLQHLWLSIDEIDPTDLSVLQTSSSLVKVNLRGADASAVAQLNANGRPLFAIA